MAVTTTYRFYKLCDFESEIDSNWDVHTTVYSKENGGKLWIKEGSSFIELKSFTPTGTPTGTKFLRDDKVWSVPSGSPEWNDIQNKPSTFPPTLGIDDNFVTDAEKIKLSNLSGSNSGDQDLSGKADVSHPHVQDDITNLVSDLNGKSPTSHNHSGTYEPANSNIQAHIGSSHAPSNAQKNSDITKGEIEAKLTGEISTHTHAGGGSVSIQQTEIDFGAIPVKTAMFTVTNGSIVPSNKIIATVSYDNPSDGEIDSAEWFEDLKIMTRAGTGQFFLYCRSNYNDINGKVKINYLIG